MPSAPATSRHQWPFQAPKSDPPCIEHLPSRLCLSVLKHAVACKFRALMNMVISRQRFAIRLPSDPQSPTKPLPSANHSPCRAGIGLSAPSTCALQRAPMKKGTRRCLLIKQTDLRSEAVTQAQSNGLMINRFNTGWILTLKIDQTSIDS